MNFAEWISTMTVDEVAATVLAYLKVLAWPLFFLIVLHKFRKELSVLIARLRSLDAPLIKASFHDIHNTAKDAAAAEADVAKQQKEEEEERKKAQEADGHEVAAEPGGVATGNHAEGHVGEDTASNSELKELFENDAAEWQPMTWRTWQSSRQKVDRAWRDLERVTANTVKSFKLSSTDPHLEKHPDDPALFFRHMQTNYGGSKKATEAAVSIRRLRRQMSEGIVMDRDEAEALAGAIDDLTSSAKKYATLLAGRRLASHLIEKYGDEKLPTVGP